MQAQPPQGPRRHRLARRSVAVLEALAQNPVHALEPLPLAVRLECTDPLAAPSLDSLAGAAQLRVGQGHRDLRQIASLPQCGVPALFTEQLLDIRQVVREHPRVGRDSSWMGVPHLVTAVRSALLSVSVLHESCLRIVPPCRQSSHPACHRPDECRDMFGDRCGPWRVPSDLCGPVSQGSAVSNNIDLRTLKVKYSANPTAHPYGKTLRRNSGETRRRRIKPTATKKPLRLTSGCPTQPKLSCVWPLSRNLTIADEFLT